MASARDAAYRVNRITMSDAATRRAATGETPDPIAALRTAIDPESSAPLYQQLFLILRERIRAGVFASGALLPSEQDLAAITGVSRITVKRALNELASAGLVSRHRGRGTMVTFNPHIPVIKASFENLLDSLRIMGVSTDVQLIRAVDIPAPADVAELLGIAEGARVQRATRLRKIEGAPLSYLVTFVPAEIAAKFTATRLSTTPLLQLLEEAGHEAVEAEQWVTACAAEGLSAQYLDINHGAPLLKIVRVMRDKDGRGIEVLHGFYRPERFQQHVRMTRRRRGGANEWR
jgi:GntR family transcriptional regulator